MSGWKKCPSVTPGGKPVFYHNAVKKMWVVWCRFQRTWKISQGVGTLFEREGKSNFPTATAAMKAAERIAV
jgi:hypothetical protein